jgi:hypothetical protein
VVKAMEMRGIYPNEQNLVLEQRLVHSATPSFGSIEIRLPNDRFRNLPSEPHIPSIHRELDLIARVISFISYLIQKLFQFLLSKPETHFKLQEGTTSQTLEIASPPNQVVRSKRKGRKNPLRRAFRKLKNKFKNVLSSIAKELLEKVFNCFKTTEIGSLITTKSRFFSE